MHIFHLDGLTQLARIGDGVVNPKLRVDWPLCRGRGLCHELMPDVVALEKWGYPIVPDSLESHQVADAREAVRVCPTLALRLVDAPR